MSISPTILAKRSRLAQILTDAREAKGLTQEQLGKLTDCSTNTIARIETARFSPNLDQVYQLCDVLEISIVINGETV